MRKSGFSLLEILVVLSVFSILAILTTQALLLTLKGTRKSDTTSLVRENVDHAISIMERNLRNATEVDPCPNATTTRVDYRDQNGIAASFSCVSVLPGSDGYIASGSARLTSDQVRVTACSLTCEVGDSGAPNSVSIAVTAEEADPQDPETGGVFSSSTQIFLRTY